MCSHLLEMAERLCSRLAIISEGRVVGLGTLEDLKEDEEKGLDEVFVRMVGRKMEDLESEIPEPKETKE
jgi:ABC-2 type transport system ATP-binding protein